MAVAFVELSIREVGFPGAVKGGDCSTMSILNKGVLHEGAGLLYNLPKNGPLFLYGLPIDPVP